MPPLAVAMYLAATASILLTITWLALPGTPGPNRFGNDPTGAKNTAAVFD
jgi:uncharacterized membrane protein YhaH (DUF805 family)